MGKGLTMKEKKFDALSIIISAAALAFSFFSFSVEAIAAAVITLIICYRRKDRYRTKIAVIFSILAIIGSLSFIAFLCYVSRKSGYVASDYWLIQLIFGKAV